MTENQYFFLVTNKYLLTNNVFFVFVMNVFTQRFTHILPLVYQVVCCWVFVLHVVPATQCFQISKADTDGAARERLRGGLTPFSYKVLVYIKKGLKALSLNIMRFLENTSWSRLTCENGFLIFFHMSRDIWNHSVFSLVTYQFCRFLLSIDVLSPPFCVRWDPCSLSFLVLFPSIKLKNNTQKFAHTQKKNPPAWTSHK